MKVVTTVLAAAIVAVGTAAGAFAQTPAAPAKPAMEAAKPMVKETAKPMAKEAMKPTAKKAMKPAKKMKAHAAMSRHRVEEIQAALNRAGAKIPVDGYWGAKTTAAVKTFQKGHGMKATGHLDHATLKALDVQPWKN
jgi:peptidoglycan hydrolase-like protein with peptidoglycan-binding domain